MAFSSSSLQKLWKKFLLVTPPPPLQTRVGTVALISNRSRRRHARDAELRAKFEEWSSDYGVSYNGPEDKESGFQHFKSMELAFLRNDIHARYASGGGALSVITLHDHGEEDHEFYQEKQEDQISVVNNDHENNKPTIVH